MNNLPKASLWDIIPTNLLGTLLALDTRNPIRWVWDSIGFDDNKTYDEIDRDKYIYMFKISLEWLYQYLT